MNRAVATYKTETTLLGLKFARGRDRQPKGTEFKSGRTFAIIFELAPSKRPRLSCKREFVRKAFLLSMKYEDAYDILANQGEDALRDISTAGIN